MLFRSQWTVVMARNIPADMLARVSAYDALGSVGAMPAGAMIAGPVAAMIGVPATEYGAAVLVVVVTALALLPRDVRRLRSAPVPLTGEQAGEAGQLAAELADIVH